MAKTKNIIIPELWSEVKYKDYLRFIESIKDQEEDNQLVTEMCLQYLCNLEVSDYYKLNTKTFKSVTATIQNLLLNQSKQPLATTIKVFDLEYRFEPDIENMSYGMYLDLTTYSKDIWKNMPIICSILYRPVIAKAGTMYELRKYNGTDDNTVQMFREMLTMDIVHGVVSFYLALQKELIASSLDSSMKKMKANLTIQQQETLMQNGVDIHQLSRYVEVISQNLKK